MQPKPNLHRTSDSDNHPALRHIAKQPVLRHASAGQVLKGEEKQHHFVSGSLNMYLQILNRRRNINELIKILHPDIAMDRGNRMRRHLNQGDSPFMLRNYRLSSPAENCYEVCATVSNSSKFLGIAGRVEIIDGRFKWVELQLV